MALPTRDEVFIMEQRYEVPPYPYDLVQWDPMRDMPDTSHLDDMAAAEQVHRWLVYQTECWDRALYLQGCSNLAYGKVPWCFSTSHFHTYATRYEGATMTNAATECWARVSRAQLSVQLLLAWFPRIECWFPLYVDMLAARRAVDAATIYAREGRGNPGYYNRLRFADDTPFRDAQRKLHAYYRTRPLFVGVNHD